MFSGITHVSKLENNKDPSQLQLKTLQLMKY